MSRTIRKQCRGPECQMIGCSCLLITDQPIPALMFWNLWLPIMQAWRSEFKNEIHPLDLLYILLRTVLLHYLSHHHMYSSLIKTEFVVLQKTAQIFYYFKPGLDLVCNDAQCTVKHSWNSYLEIFVWAGLLIILHI